MEGGLEGFVVDAEGPKDVRLALSAKVDEFDGGVVLVPLPADEGLDDIACGLFFAGEELAWTVALV